MAVKRARLQHVDIDAVLAAYADTDTPVRAICAAHRIGWTALYRLLDEHHLLVGSQTTRRGTPKASS